MKKELIIGLLVLLISVGAFVIRVVDLDRRPMHHDEANQAVRFGCLLRDGTYAYDPDEHHGPTLYYLALPLAWASGGDYAELSEHDLRIGPVLFGSGIVLLSIVLLKGIGRGAVFWIAIFTALSPGMIYYSRYFIQESLLVFFTFGAIAAGWRYYHKRTLGSAVLAGICLGLMYATKETCIIAWGCMAIAMVGVALSEHKEPVMDRKHLAILVGTALFISVLLFSSFLTHWSGVLDSVLAYKVYLSRSEGTESLHSYGFLFYLKRLFFFKTDLRIWSEAIIAILAVVGAFVIVFKHDTMRGEASFLLFILIYTVSMVLVYSLISYKTPWCMLSFLHGMIILAGIGAAWLVRTCKSLVLKVPVTALILLGVGHLAVGACWANFRGYETDERNPYAYEHTSYVFMRMVERIDDIAKVSEFGENMFVAVVAPPVKTWPLPWYLRKYKNAGFWVGPDEPFPVPVDKLPALVVTSEETDEVMAERLGDRYTAERHGLRPGVILYLHIRKDLWDKFMADRQ